MNNLLKNRQIRMSLYIIGAVSLSFAAKGISSGTAVYGWILGTTIAVALADAAMPTIKTMAKSAFIGMLRMALPYVAKYIRPEEVVATIGTTQGISVGALNAAVQSKGVFGLQALQAILAGAETDTRSLRSMLRGAALAAINNGYQFTAIAEAEAVSAQAESLKLAAEERKASAQRAYEDQVAMLREQLRMKLVGEEGIIGEQQDVIAGLSPLLTVAPDAGITQSSHIN